MDTNALPHFDMSDNPTHCCPRFQPEAWDEKHLHFDNKLFIKAKTISFFHIPINIGFVFPKVLHAIEDAGAMSEDDFIVLSYDTSPWTGEHYFSATHEIPGQKMVRMSGDFLTKVFEGPYKNVPKWEKDMQGFVESQGKQARKTYFFFTTCPKCARYYGKNYVVAVSELEPA